MIHVHASLLSLLLDGRLLALLLLRHLRLQRLAPLALLPRTRALLLLRPNRRTPPG